MPVARAGSLLRTLRFQLVFLVFAVLASPLLLPVVQSAPVPCLAGYAAPAVNCFLQSSLQYNIHRTPTVYVHIQTACGTNVLYFVHVEFEQSTDASATAVNTAVSGCITST
jgi:hypothetical protein